MTAKDIQKIIKDDLESNPKFFNPHNIDIKRCSVEPKKLKFENSFSNGELLDLWLVLKEKPDSNDGYLIIYNEQNSKFGLAIYGKNEPVFIGYQGTFTETLSGM